MPQVVECGQREVDTINIPEFDMMVLADIVDCKSGWSREELVAKHGSEILKTVDFLLENQLIKEHSHNLAPFLPPGSDYTDPPLGNLTATDTGRIEVKRWRAKTSLTAKERWKERLIGAGVTVLVWLLQELIKRAL